MPCDRTVALLIGFLNVRDPVAVIRGFTGVRHAAFSCVIGIGHAHTIGQSIDEARTKIGNCVSVTSAQAIPKTVVDMLEGCGVVDGYFGSQRLAYRWLRHQLTFLSKKSLVSSMPSSFSPTVTSFLPVST